MPKKEEFKKYSDNDIEDFQKKSIEDPKKNLILSHQKNRFFSLIKKLHSDVETTALKMICQIFLLVINIFIPLRLF